MRVPFHKTLCACGLSAALALGAAGCMPTADTISSLTDLVASTSGSLIQIFVKAAIDQFLALLAPPDLTAPISSQMH